MSREPVRPDVSIIVVSWNGREYIDECLDGVGRLEGVHAETILVDNASTDGTAAYVKERFPWVRLVELPENRGFAGGNNAGVQQARGEYVALLNNDAVPEPGWLAALLRDARAGAGLVLTTSCVVYAHDPRVIDSAGDGMLRWGGAFKRLHGADVGRAGESMEVFGVCGAACLVPRRVFVELGGFDEDFFVSHEDVDLSYRARLLGYRCQYVADAMVRHRGSVTLGRQSPLAIFHGQRNLEWVYLKNTPGWLLLRTLPGHMVYVAAAAAHCARMGALWTFLRAKGAAVVGVPRMLRKRSRVQATRRVGARGIWPHLDRGWLATKWREKRFDAALGGGGR